MDLRSGFVQITADSEEQFYSSLDSREELINHEVFGTVSFKASSRNVGPRSLGVPWLDTLVLTPKIQTSLPQIQEKQQSRSMLVGDVLELVGPSACGKSLLIYEILLHTILPVSWTPPAQPGETEPKEIPIGGIGGQVYYFDCDMRIDMNKILELGVERVSFCIASQKRPDRLSQGRGISFESITNLVKYCLKHLHIFRPTSSKQLLFLLAALPSRHPSNLHSRFENGLPGPSKHPNNIIIIDSLTQFYWASKKAVSYKAKNQHYHHQKILMDVLKDDLVKMEAFALVVSWPPFPRRAQNFKTDKSSSYLSSISLPSDHNSFFDDLNSSEWSCRVTYRLQFAPSFSSKGKAEVEIKLVHPALLPGQIPFTRRAAVGPYRSFVQKTNLT